MVECRPSRNYVYCWIILNISLSVAGSRNDEFPVGSNSDNYFFACYALLLDVYFVQPLQNGD